MPSAISKRREIMKKSKKNRVARVPEIASLNEELFSLVSGNPLATIDDRIALAVAMAGNFICDTFTCGSYSGTCGSFGCGTFKIKPV
jgi:hypothetical protein